MRHLVELEVPFEMAHPCSSFEGVHINTGDMNPGTTHMGNLTVAVQVYIHVDAFDLSLGLVSLVARQGMLAMV